MDEYLNSYFTVRSGNCGFTRTNVTAYKHIDKLVTYFGEYLALANISRTACELWKAEIHGYHHKALIT